jgi:demethylmenaquinone methyltransferase/2-methoxy-6-polyprenyl-1,4-benzoquinol methylase
MSFKLPESAEKADYVLNQFDRIAARYDLTNDVISLGMHRLWKAKAVSSLIGNKSGKYLDVCTGTGDLALTIASRLNSGGQVVGLDFSANMLSVASSRANNAQAKGAINCMVAFSQGDAQNLPFDDNSFDGAIISFGLRNLTNLSCGLSEMARVVKPGGRVVNLDLGHPTLPLFAPFFLTYFRHVVPVIGDLLQKDKQAYTYLPESLNTYPKPDKISELFSEAGLKNVQYLPLALGSVALHVGEVT